MDLDEQARRLRMHVEQLAGKIGERNVFCPASLHATASYIEHEWEQQGARGRGPSRQRLVRGGAEISRPPKAILIKSVHTA